jgi:hypothetical protein
MPDLSISHDAKRGVVVDVKYGERDYKYFDPISTDPMLNGKSTLELAARQNKITLAELMNKLNEGQVIHFRER